MSLFFKGLFYCLLIVIINFIYKAFAVDKYQLIKEANILLDRVEYIFDCWIKDLKEREDAAN